MTFKAGDPNTILIGGNANTAAGDLYSIGVTRGAGNHITGFTGTATLYADAAYNDGGVVYGPGNVLFLARWPVNEIGQTKPGSAITDKIVDLDPLGVTPSPGGLSFVPAGFPGAGQLKLVSWAGGQWYTLGISADGSGTYNINTATLETTIGGGLEGIFYVPPGSPLFTDYNNVLIAEYSAGEIGAYSLDGNGDPIPASRVDFITGLTGAEGATIDPLTEDFLFSTFGGGNRVIVVQGFAPPVTTTTTTSTTTTTTSPPITTTTSSTTTTTTIPQTEISCSNGIDDDGDGLVDCRDPDCRRDPACVKPKEVPIVTPKGTVIYGVLLMAAGIFYMLWRRRWEGK